MQLLLLKKITKLFVIDTDTVMFCYTFKQAG